MKLFVHFACDMFGAEFLGRADLILRDISDRQQEKHVYVWAGTADPPVNKKFWSSGYPIWDVILWRDDEELQAFFRDMPHGFELDRAALAGAVRSSLSGDGYLRRFTEIFSASRQGGLAENIPARPFAVYAVSLADPVGSAIMMGLLQGVDRFQEFGNVDHITSYGVCGLGHLSSSNETIPANNRILAAHCLQELQQYQAEGKSRTAMPFYLVGENTIGRAVADRKAQAALASFATVAIVRSAAADHRVGEQIVNPFDFIYNPYGEVHSFANGYYDSQCPFVMLGGYGVYCPVEKPASILAAGVCRRTFDELAKQRQEPTIEASSRVKIPANIETFVQRVLAEEVSAYWKRIGDKSGIPWDSTDEADESHGWFELACLRKLIEPIFANRDWERLLSFYAGNRFKALPIDEWLSAVGELRQVIEEGYLPSRKRQIDLLHNLVLNELLAGLDRAVEKVFKQTAQEPVHLEPHRVTQALLGRVYREITTAEDKLQQSMLQQPSSEAEDSLRAKNLVARQQELVEAIESVPSPIAVFMRLLPIIALCSVLGLLIPVPEHLDFAWLKGGIGATCGLLFALVVFTLKVKETKRSLLARFNTWFEAYKNDLARRDSKMREDVFGQTLGLMKELLTWYFNGQNEKPPIPDDLQFHPKPEQPRKDSVPEALSGDVLTRQAALSDFSDCLSAAAESYKRLEQELLSEFQVSSAETILPMLDGYDSRFFKDQLRQRVESWPPERWLGRVMRKRKDDGGKGLLPFFNFKGLAKLGDIPVWRRSFQIPAGQGLSKLGERGRELHSGYQFFCTVKEEIMGAYFSNLSLADWVQRYAEKVEGEAITASSLFDRYANRVQLSADVTEGDFCQFVVASADNDPLSTGIGPQWINSLGGGRVSIHLQCQLRLNAENIIFFPNRENPTNLMGRAYRQHLAGNTGSLPALKPITLTAEVNS